MVFDVVRIFTPILHAAPNGIRARAIPCLCMPMSDVCNFPVAPAGHDQAILKVVGADGLGYSTFTDAIPVRSSVISAATCIVYTVQTYNGELPEGLVGKVFCWSRHGFTSIKMSNHGRRLAIWVIEFQTVLRRVSQADVIVSHRASRYCIMRPL